MMIANTLGHAFEYNMAVDELRKLVLSRDPGRVDCVEREVVVW